MNHSNIAALNTNKNSLKNFVIISVPRSGTNYLSSLLDSHPEILCHLEVFHPNAIYYGIGRSNEMPVQKLEERDRNPMEFLSTLWNKRFDKKIIGFKIFDGHNDKVLSHVLTDQSINKIILTRRNMVRAYVSTLISEMTGEYCKIKNRNSEGSKLSYIYFDINSFHKFVKCIEKFYIQCEKTMTETGQSFLKVNYPDILNKQVQIEILKFLGVSVVADKLHSPFLKQGMYQLEDIIKNYAEVKQALKGTRHYDDLVAKDG